MYGQICLQYLVLQALTAISTTHHHVSNVNVEGSNPFTRFEAVPRTDSHNPAPLRGLSFGIDSLDGVGSSHPDAPESTGHYNLIYG